jgi:hypothetical protein
MLLAIIVAMVAAGVASAEAQTDLESVSPFITAANLNGTCGFTAVATKVDPNSSNYLAPDGWVGTILFNGAGKATANVTVNQHGTVQNINVTNGTYSVNADGRTGTIDFTPFSSDAPLLKFVVTSNATEVRFINIGPTDPTKGIIKSVITGVCKF